MATGRSSTAEAGQQLALAVQVKWGEQRVAAYTLRPGSSDCLCVGSSAGVDFTLPAGLVGERLKIAHVLRGPRVVLPRGVAGQLTSATGQTATVDELRRGGAAQEFDGEVELELGVGDRLVLELGALQLEAWIARAPRLVRRTTAWDYRWLNTLLGTASVAAFVVVSWTITVASGSLDDEPTSGPPPTRLRALVSPPVPPPTRAVEKREAVPERGAPPEARRPTSTRTRAAPAARAGGTGALRQLLAGGLFEGGLPLPEAGRSLAHLTQGLTTVSGSSLGGLTLRGDASGGGREQSIGLGGVGPRREGGPPGEEPALHKPQGPELPEPTISDVLISGYDRELIRSAVRAHRGELRYCYEVRLSRRPSLEGRVLVKFSLGPDGHVQHASVVSSSVNDLELEACLVGRVRGWRFPAPKGGAQAVVTYPFVFARPTP